MALNKIAEKPKKGKRKFRIEELSESTRKTIFTITIIVLILIIIPFWLYFLKITLNSSKEKPKDETWKSIQTDLDNFLTGTKETFDTMKDQINQLTEPTTTPASPTRLDSRLDSVEPGQTAERASLGEPTTTVELSPEEIEKLKEKLLKQ